MVYDYVGKADLNKGCWNPKTKLGITTHFSEVTELWKENAINCFIL